MIPIFKKKHLLKSQSHLFIKILNPLWLSPSHERENIWTQVVRKGVHLEVPGTAGTREFYLK
jgi:hypothetical protein